MHTQVRLRVRKPEGTEAKHLMQMLKQLHEQQFKEHKEKHGIDDDDDGKHAGGPHGSHTQRSSRSPYTHSPVACPRACVRA